METATAWRSGIFGMILIGLSSLLLGLMSRFLSLDPIVYFAAMAGVLVPAVMVAAGALARWSSLERATLGASLASGLVTLLGGASLCFMTLAISQYSPYRLAAYFSGIDTYGSLGILVLFAAYLALSAIGGLIYGYIFPAEKTMNY
jgi:hypothetical protein